MNDYIKQFDNCLQHEVSFCSAACPFNLDVNTFISRLQEGRFNAAYKIYRDAVGFPFIASRICSAPCREACLRNAVSGDCRSAAPVELAALEKACLEYARRTEPVDYNIPEKNKSIAIIGAGISGMACALRLATKKYKVTIYEKKDCIGGGLTDIADSEILNKDFSLQMKHLKYKIRFNTEISSLEQVLNMGREDNKEKDSDPMAAVAAVMRSASIHRGSAGLETYDAVYVATGRDGNSFGISMDDLCGKVGETAVFLGGGLTGLEPAYALAGGLKMATAIENYMMTGILKYPVSPKTKIAIDDTAMVTTEAVIPSELNSSDGLYSQDEAVKEAGRCMKCQCNACQLHCDLTEYLHKWPLRLRDEVLATTAPGKSELHASPAVRTINTCTHCGLCAETCPESIDMDAMFRAARVKMHKLKKMPWAFNDYFLRDMDFSNKEAHLCGRPDDSSPSEYAFFPGCQLGAGSPELVSRSYEYLRTVDRNAGIILGCCGIPAGWAGNEELMGSVLQQIRNDWDALGRPVLVLACPTCRKTFSQYLPEIPLTFIYDLMAETGYGNDCKGPSTDTIYSVFDSCATKEGDTVRASVRKLCRNMGIETEPLPVQEHRTACCSYGGQGAVADPDFTKFVRSKRIEESSRPYITYCINCRDAFLQEGKDAVHILNLIFDVRPGLDTLTERRKNRLSLKETLMNSINCKSPINDNNDSCKKNSLLLEMSEDIRQKISREYIIEDEVADVIHFCERTGRTFYDSEKNSYTGYRKIGNLTYWVEYMKTDRADVFTVLNAYTHRMEIELEMIWNGKKVDIDM